MELPTYTSIWRIEKRLYKLYDFRLPMPLPVGQIAAFAGITVPYVLLLTLAGLPFSHTLFWLYVLPPGLLTWLATRPVLESKRLPELIASQLRYLGEPSAWCRMAPLAERDDIAVYGRVWRRVQPAVAVAAGEAAGDDVAVEQMQAGAQQPGLGWPTVPARDPASWRPVASPAEGRVIPSARPEHRGRQAPGRAPESGARPPHRAGTAGGHAGPPQRAAPGRARGVAWPGGAGLGSGLPPRPAPPRPVPPADPAWPDGPELGRRGLHRTPWPADSGPAAQPGPGPHLREERGSPVPEAPEPHQRGEQEPGEQDRGRREPGRQEPGEPRAFAEPGEPRAFAEPGGKRAFGEPGEERLRQQAAEQRAVHHVRPVVVVPPQRPPVVERALGAPGVRPAAGWRGQVTVVPGGQGPGRPDPVKEARERALLPLAGPRLAVVLGCSVGAGQTVTALMLADLLARLRGEPVAALDLNPGPASLTELAGVPAIGASTLLAPRIPTGQPAHAAPRRGQGAQRETGDGPLRADILCDDLEAAGGAVPLAARAGHGGALNGRPGRLLEFLASRYPLTVADPGAAAVARVLPAADQLVLVAPSSPDSAQAVGMTLEWLGANGHGEVSARAVTVLNGVSQRSVRHAEQAEAVVRGRCRAIVRVPWDDHLAEPEAERGIRESLAATAGAPPRLDRLRPAVLAAYTALAGVVVSALAGAEQRDRAAR